DRESPALHATQILAPAIGPVAIHVFKEVARIMGERCADGPRQLERHCRGPLRNDSRMHHQIPLSRIEMRKRPLDEPSEQGIAVGSVKYRIQRIARAAFVT